MPVRPHGVQTAERLMTAALQVHAREGHEGFTVQAVLDQSGVSLGSLYHHFGSADGLRAALYARCLGDLLDAVVVRVEATRTARQAVTALVHAYLDFTRDEPNQARYVHASSYAAFLPTHAHKISAGLADRSERLAAAFRPHVRSGALVDVSEPMLAALLIAPVAEFSRRWMLGVPGLALDDAHQVLPARTWAAVRAGRTAGSRD